MSKKTLRKCSGCHTLIEVCVKTPANARRYCTECMNAKLAMGCVVCGAHKNQSNKLNWFQGNYACDDHLNSTYSLPTPKLRRCSSLQNAAV